LWGNRCSAFRLVSFARQGRIKQNLGAGRKLVISDW
jgi:hypothetical protein